MGKNLRITKLSNFNIHFEKLRNLHIYRFDRLLDAVTFLDVTSKSRKRIIKSSFWKSKVNHWKGLKKCYNLKKKVYDPIIRLGDIDKNVFTMITGVVFKITLPACACSLLIL